MKQQEKQEIIIKGKFEKRDFRKGGEDSKKTRDIPLRQGDRQGPQWKDEKATW